MDLLVAMVGGLLRIHPPYAPLCPHYNKRDNPPMHCFFPSVSIALSRMLLRTSTRLTLNLVLLPRACMSIHPEGKSCSDPGSSRILNDAPRVCMSSYPEGESCSDLGSSACSQCPSCKGTSAAYFYSVYSVVAGVFSPSLASGRGFCLSTSQLNLSRFCHRNSSNHPTYPTKSGHVKLKSGQV